MPSAGAILLRANNASEWTGPTGNNTYLIPGPHPVLIDAGTGDPAHVRTVGDALGGAPLRLVLITHHHVDHVAGVPALLERWPGAAVRGGGAGLPLEDGEIFEVGAATIRAVHTPGHAADHFCFFDERSRDLYCGDLVRLGGTIVIPASRGGDLAQYLASLEKLRDLRLARLLPAHGPAIEDPLRVIEEYLAHRRERHAQILAAHATGSRIPAEIVARVYPGLPEALTAAAEDTVLAHLRYAEIE